MKIMTRQHLVLLALAVSASTSALATSNTFETANLMDLGLQKAATFAISLKPGKTVNGREPLSATVDLGKLGTTGPQKVRDLWRRQDQEDCSGSFTVSPRPHGVVLVRMWPRGNG